MGEKIEVDEQICTSNNEGIKEANAAPNIMVVCSNAGGMFAREVVLGEFIMKALET